jgi:hypothetical protein
MTHRFAEDDSICTSCRSGSTCAALIALPPIRDRTSCPVPLIT